MRCRIILLFVLAFCDHVHAAIERDSVRIYFHDGSSVLDLSLRGNREVLDGFISRYLSSSADTARHVLSIQVEGGTSPSGTAVRNKRLSEERAATLVNHLRTRILLPDSLICVVAEGVDWDGLAALVERDSTVPAQKAVLNILRHTPIWIYDADGRIVDGRKKQLMNLLGGRVYRLLDERYFADLRNTYAAIEYKKQSEEKEAVLPKITDSAVLEEEPLPDMQPQEIVRQDTLVQESWPADAPSQAVKPLHRMAIKTNLIYDALLMPSLEVEYRIDDRWSVNLEGDMAWWRKESRHKYYQLATISPEGRYWFKTRKPWHGHYVGIFGGFSWYDLENGNRGYKGEAVMAGLSYGYMFPVGRSLSFEAGIGVGFMHTWYEEYLPVDGCYVYQQSSRMNYFGPLKLKFALVWRLWDVNRRKGGER